MTVGGTNTGQFAISGGATLSIGGGAAFSSGSSVTGAGNFAVTSGTISENGTFNVGGTNTFSGGITTFGDNCTMPNSAWVVAGGTVNFNSTGPLAVASLNLAAPGGYYCTLQGSVPITVTGPFNWTGGNFGSSGSSLVVTVNGGITFGAGGNKYFNGAGIWSKPAGAHVLCRLTIAPWSNWPPRRSKFRSFCELT